MSALYVMRYLGQIGVGSGAVYIGKGIISGVDVTGGIYDGTYTEHGGRLTGNLTLLIPQGGYLVTGAQLPPNTPLPITFDLAPDFANGQAQAFNIAGRVVHVTFQKLRDLP